MIFARNVAAAACFGMALLAPALVPFAGAHATYNISGYGSGLAGSTNGSDGMPADSSAAWTNGPVSDYTGGLPVNWYAGMHNATTARTMQTGVAPTPASGSLLAQVNTYNTANDPDLPTDRVIAMGGLSWSDPGNGGQGWGHGLDYGIIHFTPLESILANGPVHFTITLADDPSDSATTQLAFAIYGGWDTNPASSRHQTFTTSPSPVNNPLGSTGLTLIDYAVATTPGETLTRTYELDETYDGQYTVFVAGQAGVPGQYQLTITPQVVGPTFVGVPAVKLIALDKLASASKAKLVYVAKDPAVSKGAGTDAADIGIEFHVEYANDSASGSFLLPEGDAGWLVNKDTVAKFVNKAAPSGPTQAKVGVVKPGNLVKIVAKGLGDEPFDILAGGDPAGAVNTAYCVHNGLDEICHCSTFTDCTYKLIAQDSGAKLVCKLGTADPDCEAMHDH
jgi:hypothetical protein